MGKRRPKQDKTPTKKQIARRRKDQRQERLVFLGLAIVALVIIGLVGVGLYQEYIAKPASPVATVNGITIRTEDYQKRWQYQYWSLQNYIARLDSQKRQYQAQEDAGFLVDYIDQLIEQAQLQMQNLDTDVLEQSIDEVLIRQGAEEEGIVVTPAEVQAETERQFGFVRNPPSPTPTPITATLPITVTPTPTVPPMTLDEFQESYQNYLKTLEEATGFSESDYQGLVEAELLRQKLEDVLASRVPTTGDQVHARHILVENEEIAELVLNRLEEGDDFADLAKEYSQDESNKDDGGDLGWFSRGRMVPEFEEVAFSLPVGEVSEPVQTQFGYHIILVEERDPNHPLDEAALEQAHSQALDNWLQAQRQIAVIERFLTPDKIPPSPTPRFIQ